MKFGGSLSADARSIQQVAQVILAEALAWPKMVVVVSAMAGATDQLRRAVQEAAHHDEAAYRRTINNLRERHRQIVEALFPADGTRAILMKALDRWLFDALAACDLIASKRTTEATPRERDAVMSIGERLIAEILLALVQRDGLRCALLDGTALMPTDDNHQHASPVMEQVEDRVEKLLKPVLNAQTVALTGGFIGATRTNAITTLGRGGSDYTATILGSVLKAEEIWMWTHVDGIMSADPTFVPGARVIDVISYEEMRELAYFGVRLLLPRSIPMRVRNPFNLDHGGTLIQAQPSTIGLRVVSAVDGLMITTPGVIDLSQFLSQIGHLVGQSVAGPVIVMQSLARSTAVFVVLTSEGQGVVTNIIEKIKAGLHAARFNLHAVKVIAVIGGTENLNAKLSVPILAYAQGPGKRALYAVQPEDVMSAVRQLHRLVYGY
jgi:aspartate kinase